MAVCLPVHDDAQPLPAAIWHIRKMRYCRQQPRRIDYDMTLAPRHFLPAS